MNILKNSMMIFMFLVLWGHVQADERVVYYHNDVLGSPVAATDEAGEVLWREDYAPYGQKLGNDMEASIENVGYTGHRYDSETGLVYAGARMYDPNLGRFMGIDPVGAMAAVDNPVMFNRYAYANNNPYKYVDPDGEASKNLRRYKMSTRLRIRQRARQFGLVRRNGGMGIDGQFIPYPISMTMGGAEQVRVPKSGPKLLPPPKWSASGFNPAKLERHFNKHKGDWGGNMPSASAYQARAKKLLNSDVGGDVKGFTSKDGWVFRYNSRTNEFTTAKPDGTIETLFRPGRGGDYWTDQVTKYGQ